VRRALTGLVAVLIAMPVFAQTLPELRVVPRDVTEGTATVEVDVLVATPADKPARFRLTTADGTAKAGEDYVAVTRRFETASDTNLRITILDDNVAESNETFYVDVTEVENARPETTRVAVTIHDDAVYPPPEFGQTRAVEGDDWRNTTVNVYLTLPRAVPLPIALRVYSTNITARAGADYKQVDQNVLWNANERTAVLPITIYADDYDEDDETFRLTVEATPDVTAVFVIEDDDEPNALPFVSIDDATVFERTGEPALARFRVTLSHPGVDGASVRYDTFDFSTDPGDYVEQSGVIRFEPGQVLQWLEIEVAGDEEREDFPESFVVELRDPHNANLASRDVAWATIRDDDAPLQRLLRAHDTVVVERTGMISWAVFRLELTSPSTQPIEVRYAAADIDAGTGEAADRGRDYEAVLTSLVFKPGETVKDVRIAVYGDDEPEPDEHFALYFAPAIGLDDIPHEARGTIVDDDREWPLPELAIDDLRVVESSAIAQLTLRLTRPVDAAASIVVTARPGSAESLLDFEPLQTTVHFAPGESAKTIDLRLRADDVDEPLEHFEVVLSDPRGVTLVRDSAFVAIEDDDGTQRRRSAHH